jgi:hypothetical protein
MSGCFVIQDETTSQLDIIGEVQIATTTCFSGGPSGCTATPNDSGPPFTHVLLAYRLPDGVVAPEKIEGGITLAKDDSYSKALTDVMTARGEMPAGEHWVGYRSTGNATPTIGKFVFKPHFKLPPAEDGSPFRGPFKYRTVTGVFYQSSPSGSHPINCGPDPRTGYGSFGPGDGVVCIQSPHSPDPAPLVYATDDSLDTRDLGITGGGSVNVKEGAAGTLSFVADFAGAGLDASVPFQVSAESNAPGVTVKPSIGSFTAGTDSKTPIDVSISVPPTTPVGSYDVTLVAKLENGAERRRTGKLLVDLGPPVALGLPEQTVNCTNGSWTGNPTGYAYQWMNEGTAIAGATSQKYKLAATDGAMLITCQVTASNAAGTGQVISGQVRAAQHGGADVDLTGRPKLSKESNGRYLLDTGISVGCPARLPVGCGIGSQVSSAVDAVIARKSASTQQVSVLVAQGGFAVKSGKRLNLALHLTRAGAELLRTRSQLSLTAEVTTRGHSLERVTSRKQFKVSRPR